MSQPVPESPSVAAMFEVDDIKIEYHPHSGKAEEIFHFGDFKRMSPTEHNRVDNEPWHPFKSRADFEFAEIALAAKMNKSQIDALVKLVRRIADGKDNFSFASQHDVDSVWERASFKRTAVSI